MRNAEEILAMLASRGRQGKHLYRVYRLLYNRDLYLRSYARLYRNHGAMTPGATPETVDGMTLQKIDAIIATLRAERYRWTPVRRIEIPKRKGGTRPLGLPTWSDKLLQDVLRQLLEAFYEPQFSDASHGFRPVRGCHSALDRIKTWPGTVWFIEGDISKCFDSLDHEVMVRILGEKIKDGRLLNLIQGLLDAGYLEDWKYHRTMSGAPQGGVLSPILSNIYLDRLDHFVDETLIPQYTRGPRVKRGYPARCDNPLYRRWVNRKLRAWQTGDRERVRQASREMRKLPSLILRDPDYRKLAYVRYADDFLLGFVGTKHEAQAIKERIRSFLQEELKLTLSEGKTLITHAKSEKARFLGYEITTSLNDTKVTKGRRSTNGVITLLVPQDVVQEKIRLYTKRGKPAVRTDLLHDDDYSIIAGYQAVLRGFSNYYLKATNVSERMKRLRMVMNLSLQATLASKHRTCCGAIRKKYLGRVETAQGPKRVIQVRVPRPGKPDLVAYFDGLDIHYHSDVRVDDHLDLVTTAASRSELLQRVLAEKCELCGGTEGIQVHHIRKLKDLTRYGKDPPQWVRRMANRKRKTLVVCGTCHGRIHQGKYDGPSLKG